MLSTEVLSGPELPPEELAKAREVFWDIFMVKHDSDCYNDFAIALGCDRNRAKQFYYFILYQKGHMQNQQMQERRVRGKLAVRIRKYTEFLDNPETIYQILARAEDEVEEGEEKRRMGQRNADST
ncbi:hypothetical protein CB7_40 [Pectobacterium phage vB_PatM_CB7]|nr:hypothetical protein CB7_40 [Pectobacterium phage vB_PatM_CB7]